MMSIIIVAALVVVLGILAAGILNMRRTGEDAARLSNKLMRWRIVAQLAAIILIMLLAVVANK